MNAKYSAEAAIKARNAKSRVMSNAKKVTDNRGATYLITARRRVIGILNCMSGSFESASCNDGLLFKSGAYYLFPNQCVQPAA